MPPRTLKLGSRIRNLRKGKGLTQADLAAHLSISPSYLNLIEHDRRPVSLPVAVQICRVFELNLESFLNDDKAPLLDELKEVIADPILASFNLEAGDIQELTTNPNLCRAVLALYQAYCGQCKSHKNSEFQQIKSEFAQHLTEELDEVFKRAIEDLRTKLTKP